MQRKSLDEIFGNAKPRKSLDEIFGVNQPEKIEQPIQQPAQQEPQQQDESNVLGAVSAFARGGDFGLGRKASGVINALATAPVDWLAEALDKDYKAPTRAERYAEIVEKANEAEKQFKEENPVIGTGLEIAGAIANPANLVGAGIAAKGAGLGSKIVRGAGVGGATGGLYGAGRSESIDELKKNIVDDALMAGGIGAAFPVVGKALQGVKALGRETLGITTGAGGKSISRAYEAGKRGSKEFLENMRGTTPMTDVVQDAKDALTQIKIAKNNQYAKSMEALKTDKTVLDLNPVKQQLKEIKSEYKVGKFSKAGKDTKKALSEITRVVNEFNKKGTHTAEGFDALKQRIDDITFGQESREANRVVRKMANSVKSEINKQAPTYSKIMKDYSVASDTVRELEKTLSLSDKKSIDTSLRKLQSVFRNNVSSNYGERANLLAKLDPTGQIQDAIAGQMLSDVMPRGLVSRLGGGSLALSGNLATLPLFSPRIMGEALYGAGKVAGKIKTPPLNKSQIMLELLRQGE